MKKIHMKKIINNPKIQTLMSILIVFASYIVSSLQGIFGIVFPFVLLAFFILVILFVYYIAVLPVLEILEQKSSGSDRVFNLEQIKEYEMTADIKEIWVITSNLKLAFDKNKFGAVINTNIARGVKYKFFINDNKIAKERAAEMVDLYRKTNGLFEVYLIPEELPFVDQNTDYDLFFANEISGNQGLIGITINDTREYVTMSQELFIKLKLFLTNLKLECWNSSIEMERER